MAPTERKSLQIKVRFTLFEKMTLREAADRAREPFTDWLRARLLAAAQRELGR